MIKLCVFIIFIVLAYVYLISNNSLHMIEGKTVRFNDNNLENIRSIININNDSEERKSIVVV